jgi:hypothetical protein
MKIIASDTVGSILPGKGDQIHNYFQVGFTSSPYPETGIRQSLDQELTKISSTTSDKDKRAVN